MGVIVSDDLAPIVSDWLFLFRLSADAEEKEICRLVALLDDDAAAGRAVETPGIWQRIHVTLTQQSLNPKELNFGSAKYLWGRVGSRVHRQ